MRIPRPEPLSHLPEDRSQSVVWPMHVHDTFPYLLTYGCYYRLDNLSYEFKNLNVALAGVAQWIECQPANQQVAGSIPIEGTRLGRRPGPQ